MLQNGCQVTLTLQNKEIQLLTFSILFLISVSNVVEFPATDSTSNYKIKIMNFQNFLTNHAKKQ